MAKGRTLDFQWLPKQYEAIRAMEALDIDDVVYGGAAGGGKTDLGCSSLTYDAIRWPETRYFIGRKELKTLMQTSYVSLTQKVFRRYGLEEGKHWTFNGQRHEIHFYNGSQINLLHLGYLPSDPLYDRFGSHEYTRGWIEEASEAEFRAYDVLKSRVGRYNNKELHIRSKLLLTLNPSQDWPYRIFYHPWKKSGRPGFESQLKDPLVSMRAMLEGEEVMRTFIFIEALYKDNPFTAQEYGINLATITDPVLKARLMAADWEYSDANDVLFAADVIADMFSVAIKKTREKYLTVDVARFGSDKIVLTTWRGWNAYKIRLYEKQSIVKTADLVRTELDAEGIPREHALIDEDGVGGGVIDLVPGVLGFSGGSAPFGVVGEKDSRERYENLKTQCIYHTAQLAKDRMVAISETNLQVRELAAADLQQFKRRDGGKDGKLKVVKKEDIRDSLGRSPDVGDTIMMRAYFDLRERETALAGGGKMSVFIPDF